MVMIHVVAKPMKNETLTDGLQRNDGASVAIYSSGSAQDDGSDEKKRIVAIR